MKTLAIILALTLSSAASAAPFSDHPRSYSFTDYQGNAATSRFPWIVGGPPGVADRINSYLHDRLARTLPADDPHKVHMGIDIGAGMVSLDSEGIRPMNGGRTVRVQVASEGCGAYCSSSSEAIDFDAETGRPISALETLLPDTYAQLAPRARKERRAAIRAFKVKLQKAVSRQGKSDQARTREQIELYESCLDRDEFYGRMEIGDGLLAVASGECSVHANRALDDLEYADYVLKGEEMRPYLTSYGRKLLLGEGNGVAAPAVNSTGQLFKGTINGNLAVTLYLGSDSLDEPFRQAHYYYDKYRQQIELRAQHAGSQITLTESTADGKPGAVMTLKLSGAKLSGEWRSGDKRLPVDLTAY